MNVADEYDSVLAIDEELLDREWLKQPRAFMKYALLLAEAKRDLADAKAAFDTIKAELWLDIQQSPKSYSLDKTTEKTVEAAVMMQKEYKAANEKLIQAKYRVDLLGAVIEALEHRKKALENLVTLHGQNYFSEPRAKGEKTVLEEVAKRGARRPMKKRSK